jgi:Domain of unknown function (DUF4350)
VRATGGSRSLLRWGVGTLVVVVGLNLLGLVVNALAGGPGGPTSSSFATGPDGLAAYAGLLERFDHDVTRARLPLEDLELDPATTVILLDPGALGSEQLDPVREFLDGGGRLIAGGTYPDAWLSPLVDGAPAWTPVGGPASRPVAPVAEVEGVSTVVSAGAGAWGEARATLPVLSSSGSVTATVADQGAGRAVLLADSSMLHNAYLGRADNSVLGVDIAGGPGRPVVFVESVHGYERATGLGALPANWRWAAAGIGLASLLFMWARGRRLGPPELAARPLPPPRRTFVDSMGAILARTRRPGEAAAPVVTAARQRVGARAGLDPTADDDDFRRAAASLGLDEEEVDALLRTPDDDAGVLAAGRALAKLSQREEERP